MKIQVFKRLILNQKNEPFFLEHGISNECTLADYLTLTQETSTVTIFF